MEFNLVENLEEDTKKKKNGKWVNKGDDGEHGEFRTKKEADAQRKAMFANGYHEAVVPDNADVLDSGYCDKGDFPNVKKSQLEKYPGAKCVRQKSDTPGLQMWVTYKLKDNLTEENELEKRAKAHKKKQKGWGYFVHPNAGDVEKGIDMFNHMMKPVPPNADAATTATASAGGEGAPAGVSAGGGMGEELEEESMTSYNDRFKNLPDDKKQAVIDAQKNTKSTGWEDDPADLAYEKRFKTDIDAYNKKRYGFTW